MAKTATVTTKKTEISPSFNSALKPKEIVGKLLSALPERSRIVLESRFGLGKGARRETLESIGQRYGITRERVRQIENHALATVRKSPAFVDAKEAFDE